MRQSRPNCKIFGQARRPAPTKACRGESLWSPGSKKFDFDAALMGYQDRGRCQARNNSRPRRYPYEWISQVAVVDRWPEGPS
jgi:hypothetical protein